MSTIIIFKKPLTRGFGWYISDYQLRKINMQRRDYLAIILIGAGSSWARDPDPEIAVARVSKLIVSDWGSIYKLDGCKTIVNLFDVTGNESVHWGYDGIHGDRENEFPITKIETREVTLGKLRRKVA
jgi:hypothetical protein